MRWQIAGVVCLLFFVIANQAVGSERPHGVLRLGRLGTCEHDSSCEVFSIVKVFFDHRGEAILTPVDDHTDALEALSKVLLPSTSQSRHPSAKRTSSETFLLSLATESDVFTIALKKSELQEALSQCAFPKLNIYRDLRNRVVGLSLGKSANRASRRAVNKCVTLQFPESDVLPPLVAPKVIFPPVDEKLAKAALAAHTGAVEGEDEKSPLAQQPKLVQLMAKYWYVPAIVVVLLNFMQN